MALFTRSVRLPADLEAVFDFHRDPRNLDHVQPPGAQVLEADLPAMLESNSICSLKVKVPFGIQQWKIQVDELSLDQDSGHAVMVDRALESPFAHWVHRHEFQQQGADTIMRDEVEFQPPGGVLAWLLVLPAYLMLLLLFTFRHYKTARYFSMQQGDVQ
ncbi:MAG: hypothetical protein AAF571_07480 [Verrucomicrobiota bacterium]